MARIKLGAAGGAEYEDDPSQVRLSLHDLSNAQDYLKANPGQWFYGVVNTLTGFIYLVPGDVHDDPANQAQQNKRMLNTYASKPDVPEGGWMSLSGAESQNGIGSVPTGHNAVARRYALNTGECLGFRVIKTTDSIATFSDRSNSLNGNKPDQKLVQIVDFGTPGLPSPGVTIIQKSPKGFGASSTARMPPQWSAAVRAELSAELLIRTWAVDF